MSATRTVVVYGNVTQHGYCDRKFVDDFVMSMDYEGSDDFRKLEEELARLSGKHMDNKTVYEISNARVIIGNMHFHGQGANHKLYIGFHDWKVYIGHNIRSQS